MIAFDMCIVKSNGQLMQRHDNAVAFHYAILNSGTEIMVFCFWCTCQMVSQIQLHPS